MSLFLFPTHQSNTSYQVRQTRNPGIITYLLFCLWKTCLLCFLCWIHFGNARGNDYSDGIPSSTWRSPYLPSPVQASSLDENRNYLNFSSLSGHIPLKIESNSGPPCRLKTLSGLLHLHQDKNFKVDPGGYKSHSGEYLILVLQLHILLLSSVPWSFQSPCSVQVSDTLHRRLVLTMHPPQSTICLIFLWLF